MRRVVLTFICATGFVAWNAAPAWADDGRCLIAVDGRIYLKGRCNVDVRSGGSFTVGVGEKSRSKHFAYVNVERGSRTAQGYWNGREAESHAHEDLGTLRRVGPCWLNMRAKICAWR